MLARALRPSERRHHTRSTYHGVLQLQSLDNGTWFAVYGVDASAGGFAFVSDFGLRRGERLNVSVPELPALTVPAVVRHVTARADCYFVGIEFDEPLPGELERCLTA